MGFVNLQGRKRTSTGSQPFSRVAIVQNDVGDVSKEGNPLKNDRLAGFRLVSFLRQAIKGTIKKGCRIILGCCVCVGVRVVCLGGKGLIHLEGKHTQNMAHGFRQKGSSNGLPHMSNWQTPTPKWVPPQRTIHQHVALYSGLLD